jgi:hypothetical protein
MGFEELDLPDMSRQRRWQLKKSSQGLCVICGHQPIYRGNRCVGHYARHAILCRERYRAQHPGARAIYNGPPREQKRRRKGKGSECQPTTSTNTAPPTSTTE